jgi:hypothetical protein
MFLIIAFLRGKCTISAAGGNALAKAGSFPHEVYSTGREAMRHWMNRSEFKWKTKNTIFHGPKGVVEYGSGLGNAVG